MDTYTEGCMAKKRNRPSPPFKAKVALAAVEEVKKGSELSSDVRRGLVEWDHEDLSVRHQCTLLGVNRSTVYYHGVGETEENLRLMRLIDEQYLRTPFYGGRRMTKWLGCGGTEGHPQG